MLGGPSASSDWRRGTVSDPQQADRWKPLVAKLEARDALVGVVGLGYVGLPAATSLALAGFRVLGVDRARERVLPVNEGRSHLADVPSENVHRLRRGNRLRASTSYQGLGRADAVLICVPTPLSDGVPDVSAIGAAGRVLARVLTPDTLVILESTTYPGTTEEFLRPLLEAGGLTSGRDFLLAYSPERIDPGNPTHGFDDIPKVVGGVDEDAAKAAAALYGQVVPKVIIVSGTREAEMAKLIENTFRHVNIALVNELALYAGEWGIDIWEAIEAAATKPFGFMPFWPGPGWGGHCIPLDPSYLSWRVRRDHSHELRFVELAHNVNAEMPRRVVERISALLNEEGKALRGARILGVGVAYKGGTDDTRGSAGIKILERLGQQGAIISYHDPLVPGITIGGVGLVSAASTERGMGTQDIIVIFVAQDGVDWTAISDCGALVLDCCNALGRAGENVHRL
jgi:UDP-N-acetyl-D-glucosamine dehydrogenase